MWKRTVRSSTASTLLILAWFPRALIFFAGSSTRSNVALTSLAVNGVPSWNFTPWRSLTSHVVSSSAFHEIARLGPTLPVFTSRAARWSKTW